MKKRTARKVVNQSIDLVLVGQRESIDKGRLAKAMHALCGGHFYPPIMPAIFVAMFDFIGTIPFRLNKKQSMVMRADAVNERKAQQSVLNVGRYASEEVSK